MGIMPWSAPWGRWYQPFCSTLPNGFMAMFAVCSWVANNNNCLTNPKIPSRIGAHFLLFREKSPGEVAELLPRLCKLTHGWLLPALQGRGGRKQASASLNSLLGLSPAPNISCLAPGIVVDPVRLEYWEPSPQRRPFDLVFLLSWKDIGPKESHIEPWLFSKTKKKTWSQSLSKMRFHCWNSSPIKVATWSMFRRD